VKLYDYSIVNFGIDRWKYNNFDFIISPSRLPRIIDLFFNRFHRYNISSLSLDDMGEIINSDYSSRNTYGRHSARNIIVEQAEVISENTDKIMVHKANIYMLPFADIITEMPISHSNFSIASEGIPFYQMVVHGYVEYTTGPINLYSDPEIVLLKSLETGAGLNYKWIYEDSSVLKDTDYSNFFSTNYKDWIDHAKKFYEISNAVLSELQDKLIVGHQKLDDGVYETIYENKYTIIVNYNRVSVNIMGKEIEARSYLFERGE